MATYYSLVCWGGTAGKSVSLGASNTITTGSNHLARDGLPIQFTALESGSLPGTVALGKTYYCKYVSATSFQIYTTSALSTQVTWSGSCTVRAKSAYYLTADLTDFSTRIYDGIVSWNTARGGLSMPYDIEYIIYPERGIADRLSSTFTLSAVRAKLYITSVYKGTKTNGWPFSLPLTSSYGTMPGALFDLARNYDNTWVVDAANLVWDGISFYVSQQGSGSGLYLSQNCIKPTVKNCIFVGTSNSNVYGLYAAGNGELIYRNLFYGFTGSGCVGLSIYAYGHFISVIANNIAVGNTNGILCTGAGTAAGLYINNISVGNSTSNWSAQMPTSIYSGSGNNYGEKSGGSWTKGTPWYSGSDTGIAMSTAHFNNYASWDLTPKAARVTTISVANPGVVTLSSHGFSDGTPVKFFTNGTLPTITVGTTYYTRSVDANSFHLYDTAANATAAPATTGRIDTSAGSQTGTHQVSWAPQIDSGAVVLDVEALDIRGAEVPNYLSGYTELWDGGAYEYDHGYSRPLTRNLNFTGLVPGSQVVVYTSGTTTEIHRTPSTVGTTDSFDAQANVTVDYTIMLPTYEPIRVTGLSLASDNTNVAIQQKSDRAYVASSGLSFGSTAIVNVSGLAVTTLQVTTATTVQNWYSCMIEAWYNTTGNPSLKNVPFPIKTFGEASYTIVSGITFSDGATSISKFSRDGLRFTSDAAGLTTTGIWAAILTLDTAAGIQVKYRQTTGGAIVAAASTGPMDQLVEVYRSGVFDYRGHMVLRAPKPGYSQPKPDLVATYGNLQDGLYVAALAPTLQYATTNADIDAANLALNNTAKTFAVTASHSVLDLYQRAQWWANQDAQWDADIPLTANSDGTTFTLYTGWTLSGLNYVTGSQTLTGGTMVLAGPGTYLPAFASTTVVAQAEGIYTFTANNIVFHTSPTADNVHYVLSDCTLTGTLTVRNQNAHPIVVEVPAGVTTSTTGNTGGAITFVAPIEYQSVTVSGAVAGSRIQIYDTTNSVELYNGTPTFPYTWTDSVAAAGPRAIRLRCAKQSGSTAKNFIDANIGTCAASGSGKDISYLVSQSNDETYNLNGIDGSTVTGISIEIAGGQRVKINLAGGSVTWTSIYAYQVYWQATSTGIAQETAFITSPDPANYILTDFDLKNIHPTVPLTVTGGWGRDSVTGMSKDIVDNTGTSIFLAPDHVIPYSTGSGLTAGEHAQLMGLPTADQTVTALQSAASTTPLPVEVKKVNGYTVIGSGTTGDTWRPA